jgi:hypothetical protein
MGMAAPPGRGRSDDLSNPRGRVKARPHKGKSGHLKVAATGERNERTERAVFVCVRAG